MRAWLAILGLVLPVSGFAAKKPPSAPLPVSSVKYRSSGEIHFDSTEIKGDLGRPDLVVVTGNGGDGDNGLLRLRENFLDRLASDSAEEVQ